MNQFDGLQIEVSEDMMRQAWMAYDKSGQCVATGILGMGTLKHSDAPAVRVKVGRSVYDSIKARAALPTPSPSAPSPARPEE